MTDESKARDPRIIAAAKAYCETAGAREKWPSVFRVMYEDMAIAIAAADSIREPPAAMYSQFQAQISALHRALMRRVQEDNCCRATGVDCDARGGGMLCSCSLEAQNEIEDNSLRRPK